MIVACLVCSLGRSFVLRWKLGEIAKSKAPGYSGNGPDLYASLPDAWLDWAVELANAVQLTQITPAGWHIDLIHYVHKGGSGGSLPNHRPLALVEVFRKEIPFYLTKNCGT